MKLTNQQIQYILDYIASQDIRWYELQVELSDHMASSMEEFWANDPELTFHQVKQYAEDKFGRNGFKAIEEERTKILRKEHRNCHVKLIKEYFKLPKILLSMLAVFLVYKSSFYFDDSVVFIRVLFGILLGLSAFSILNWYRFRKINGKRFLSLETAYIMNNSTLGISFYSIFLIKSWKDTVGDSYVFIMFFCCLWVLGILVQITGRHLTNKVVSDIKKQYQLS